MEFFNLESGLKCIASTGHVLNCQEIVGVQAGLMLLKSKEGYSEIFLWGKILGSSMDATKSSDYYIAYGLRNTEPEFPSKDFFYACEDFEFKTLPRLTEDVADKVLALALVKPFTGNQMEVLEPEVADEDTETEPAKVTELDRLSQVVQEIDFDTAAVPKGAYSLNEARMVVANSDFKGLSLNEATSIPSFVHFRPPTSAGSLRALAPDDSQFYASFLDPLADDLPKGCWTVRHDPCGGLVNLRSLSWPGYAAYHVLGTNKFGGAYFGYGQKANDLPFIL